MGASERIQAPPRSPGAQAAPAAPGAQAAPAPSALRSPATAHRFLDHPSQVAGDPTAAVDAALSSHGEALNPEVRSAMEARFRHSFAHVRIHTGQEAARSARQLNARAYAVGDHIVFGPAAYQPRTRSGTHLLAHELAHVLQHRAAGLEAGGGAGTVRLSSPGDPSERAAEAAAASVTAGHPVGSVGMAPPRSPAPAPIPAIPRPRAGQRVVQRFLAGEAGHGGIEEPALEEAGFTKGEAKLTYYGNWLRDFSQLLEADLPGGKQPLMELIRILATGEFGRAPTDAEIGRYLPSEHVDNPAGGTSAENPDAERHAAMVEQLSKSTADVAAGQAAWYAREQSLERTFEHRAAASGLPVYIERAKEHVREKLGEAVAHGRNEAGFRALGNALHAVEDYFAHSNFIEVALAELASHHEIAPGNPLLEATRHYPLVDPAHVGTDTRHRPQIVTGTSIKGAGDVVGMWEAIKTELRSGELLRIFLRGLWIRYKAKLPLELLKWAVEGSWGAGKAVGGFAGGWAGRLLGGAIGAVGGLFGGAASGAARGFREGHGFFGKIGGALSGLFRGAGRGVASGAEAGWATGGAVGRTVGGVAGGIAGLGLLPVAAVASASFLWNHAAAILLLGAPLLLAIDKLVQWWARREIKRKAVETVSEAKGHKPKPVPLPTHSQIAKDDPDHPLHNAAARLAATADREIGKAMLAAWATGATPKAKRAPVELVDRYLSHPADDAWWKPVLKSFGVKPTKPVP